MTTGGSAEPPVVDPAPGGRGARREAFELAVGALSRKELTIVELTRWLEGRGVGFEEVEEVVGRLIEIGELDDARFAERFADDKRELRGWGPARIRETLLERGVRAELVEEAAGGESAETILERAQAVLARRGAVDHDEGARRRALAYLTRRGFDYDVAYEAVRRAGREAA